ncbi:hypothetical protein BDZ97DRAFT_1831471 [Flammula alnicola]|nr:hypothetical protein BDZ97DRAFT_1831471 [Flammula alnicola]
MSILPTEILQEILSLSLFSWDSTVALLTTSSAFRDICEKFIYTQLHFTSRAQLASFISTYSSPKSTVPYAPRSVELDITIDESNLVFFDIYALFSQCLSDTTEGAQRDQNGRLSLDLLRLRLNSHAFDSQIEMVYAALSLVNPRQFIWTGLDPPHHFSIAIVPQAIPHLFRALSSYTNLTYLKLTHLAMLYALKIYGLPIIPSLRTLHLGQVIFLHPLTVAAFILDPYSKNLEKVYLVDAYHESIWGPRLRRSDIEIAATSTKSPPDGIETLEHDDPLPLTSAEVKNLVRCVVVCEAKTERIMGGDRVENNTLLL